jgi:hypothetical protein
VVENDVKVGWTDGNAGLRFSTGGVELGGLAIRLSGNKPVDHPLKLSVNNRTIFDGALPPGPWHGAFDLEDLAQSAELDVRLESAVFPLPELGRFVGVGIEEVKLLRRTGGKNEINTSRFPGEGLWFHQKDFLYDELLAQPEKITHLRFIGGEPLLIKEVVNMMRRLIEKRAASNIALWTITNGTVINEEYLELAQRFKSCDLMLSLDGVGAVNDYIRFPSKWDVIDKNISRLKQMVKTKIFVNMTVQAYNILNIVDMIDYCVERDIGFQYHLLQYPPYLSTAVLPRHIRDIAADRLLSFAKWQERRLCGSFMRPDLLESIPNWRRHSRPRRRRTTIASFANSCCLPMTWMRRAARTSPPPYRSFANGWPTPEPFGRPETG